MRSGIVFILSGGAGIFVFVVDWKHMQSLKIDTLDIAMDEE